MLKKKQMICLQLDELIERTEREYVQSQLPTDLKQAESMLEQHKKKKTEISQLIDFTNEEGENIVTRVRQQVRDSSSCVNILCCDDFHEKVNLLFIRMVQTGRCLPAFQL